MLDVDKYAGLEQEEVHNYDIKRNYITDEYDIESKKVLYQNVKTEK